MEVTRLPESLVPALGSYLRSDTIPNLYLLYDLYYGRDGKAAFHVAVKDAEILGVLCVYRGYPYPSAWVLGSREAVDSLLNLIDIGTGVIWTTDALCEAVEGRFPISAKYQMDAMALDASNAKILIKHEVRKLSVEDAYAWARSAVSSRSRQEVEPTPQDVEEAKKLLAENIAFGIYVGDLLVSRAVTHVRLPEAWAVGGVFTDPRYRGRGLATSVTSALVQEALRHTNRVILFVRSDNMPARLAYEKIGFRTVAKRIWLDLGTGMVP